MSKQKFCGQIYGKKGLVGYNFCKKSKPKLWWIAGASYEDGWGVAGHCMSHGDASKNLL